MDCPGGGEKTVEVSNCARHQPCSGLDVVRAEIHRPAVTRFLMTFFCFAVLACVAAEPIHPTPQENAGPQTFASDGDFLEFIQRKAFDYFWLEANPSNGLVRDRSRSNSYCSIAAVGFGLTAIGIGIDHGWITREQGRERVVRTLKTVQT